MPRAFNAAFTNLSRCGPKKVHSGCSTGSGSGSGANAGAWFDTGSCARLTSSPHENRREAPPKTETQRGLFISHPPRPLRSAIMTFLTRLVPLSSKVFYEYRNRLRIMPLRRVYDLVMANRRGWIWVGMGLLAVASLPAQTLNNQSLNGKFFFRHVSLGADATGNLDRPAQLAGGHDFRWRGELFLHRPGGDRQQCRRLPNRQGDLFGGPRRLRHNG